MNSSIDDALLLLDLPVNNRNTDQELLSAAHALTKQKHKEEPIEPRKRPKQKDTIEIDKKNEVRSCDYCKATITPMWRHGPEGYRDLCNKVIMI
jgi:hypothetical protein